MPLFAANPDSFPAQIYNKTSYEAALFLVRSRQYEIEHPARGEGATSEGGLVPMMDMMNHQWGGAEWEVEGDTLQIRALRPYSKGEQVYSNYGSTYYHIWTYNPRFYSLHLGGTGLQQLWE